MEGRTDELASRLVGLIRSSSGLMRSLRAARAVDPPDWLIGGGVTRELVWNHLHRHWHPVPSKDVDLAFFDPDSLGRKREESVRRAVTAEAPDICWDVTNQAGAHLWYPAVYGVELEPFTSSADAVASWAETATAVAVRLLADDRIQVIAPYGLKDLFGLVCRRRNPRLVSAEQYRRRVKHAHIAKRWPRVQILDALD